MKKKNSVLIFPFGGNGREAVDSLHDKEILGFIDDDKSKQNNVWENINVYGRKALQKYENAFVLAVPGNPSTYKQRIEIIKSLNIEEERFTSAIHLKASVSSYAKIGKNVLIMAGAVINAGAVIEDHVCILPNTVVHHDSVIRKYTLLGANVTITGYSIIEENCYIGSGSNIINGINIGARSLIGMGSNVIRNVSPDSKIAGNPAKSL